MDDKTIERRRRDAKLYPPALLSRKAPKVSNPSRGDGYALEYLQDGSVDWVPVKAPTHTESPIDRRRRAYADAPQATSRGTKAASTPRAMLEWQVVDPNDPLPVGSVVLATRQYAKARALYGPIGKPQARERADGTIQSASQRRADDLYVGAVTPRCERHNTAALPHNRLADRWWCAIGRHKLAPQRQPSP